MRTKTLLLTAAIMVAGLGASMAQVYSVNAVGYVNVTLKAGYNLVANPLNGSNNVVSTILPATALPDDTILLTWNTLIQDFNQADFVSGGQWYDQLGNPATTVIPPGRGIFIQLPPGSTDKVATFVGEVPQGNLTNRVAANFDFVSSIVPQAAGLSTIGFPGVIDMTLQTFNTAIGDYNQAYSYVGTGVYPTGWADSLGNPADPVLAVGQGALVFNPGASQNWVRSFSVN